MEAITRELVQHVALLARLEPGEQEIESFVTDLNKILSYVDKLNELDTTGVAPTSHSFAMENVFRQDTVHPCLSNEDALSNAPEAEEGCFKVPAVLQDTGGA